MGRFLGGKCVFVSPLSTPGLRGKPITPHKGSTPPASPRMFVSRKAVLWDTLEPGCCTGKIQHPGDEFIPKPTLGGLFRAGSPQLLLCQPAVRGDGCGYATPGYREEGLGFPGVFQAGRNMLGHVHSCSCTYLMPQCPVPDCPQHRAGSCPAERLWQAQGHHEQMHLLHKELLPGSALSSWQVALCF